MKKIIATSLIALTLAGCASGPDKGYYDQNGQYHASASATNEDRWQTAGVVALAGAAVAALTLGIVANTK